MEPNVLSFAAGLLIFALLTYGMYATIRWATLLKERKWNNGN